MHVGSCPACKAVAPPRKTWPNGPGSSVFAGGKELVQDPFSVCECDECGLFYKTQTMTSEQFAG